MSKKRVVVGLVVGLVIIGAIGSALGPSPSEPSPSPRPTEAAAVTSPPETTQPSDTAAPTDPTLTPTPESTPGPTAEPTAVPTEEFFSFGDGTWEVGVEIPPDTYRTREGASFCYWARLKGFGGELEDIIANDNLAGFGVVAIDKTDEGFETNGCPDWSEDLSAVTASRTEFGEGTFIVGTDMKAGRYRSSGGDFCYWARLTGFGGELEDIIANDNVSGPTLVAIDDSDKGFQSRGCGTWALG